MIRRRLASVCGGENYAPPAPVMEGITVCDLAGNSHPREWAGLVDTGADRTVVPLVVCEDLGLNPRDWRRPSGFDRQATPRRVPLYYLRLAADGLPDVPLLVYGVRRPSILLGRDFLSGLLLVIDSDRSWWELGRHGAWSKLVLNCLRLQ